MFAKGKIRGNGAQLAGYLMTGTEGERVEIVETRGLEAFGRDPIAAFAAMQDIADANTQSTKPFFHGHVRLPAGERLTDAQWMETLELMEKRLGFEGQPRIVTFHHLDQNGDKHLHVGWFRIDLETMRAIDPGLYKNELRELSRDRERAYGLRQLDNERQAHDIAPAASQKETEESRRLGTDVREIRAVILDCFEHSDSGRAFNAALEERGLMLANGDRRDCFVVIDQEGGQHALNKKLTGLTLAAIRERFADLDRSQLPGVEKAQETQRERHAERTLQPETANQNIHEPMTRTLGKTSAEIVMAWTLGRSAEQFEEALAANGISLAVVSSDEAAQSQRTAAFAREIGNFAPVLQAGEIVAVNDHGNVYRFNQRTMGENAPDIEARFPGLDRVALMNVADTKEAMQTAALEAWKAERAAEREQARPASWIESRIAALAEQTARLGATVLEDASGRRVDRSEALADRLRLDGERQTHTVTVQGREAFMAQLDDAGIAIVRVTETDAHALDALRTDENLARIAAETNDEAYRTPQFAKLLPGELAAVTRNGNVHRINSDKFSDAKQFLDAADLPGVVETRARFEIEGERQAEVWAQHRADIAEWQLQQENDRASTRFEAVEIKGGMKAAERQVEAAPMETVEAVREGVGLFARIGQAVLGLFGGWALAPPKLTAEQSRLEARAEAEAAPERAAAAQAAAEWKTQDDGFEARRRAARQLEEAQLGRILGHTTPAEAQRDVDFTRTRQRERERDDY
jgi:hypothetical protein